MVETERFLTPTEHDFAVICAEAHVIDIRREVRMVEFIRLGMGWQSTSAVSNMLYKIAPLFSMEKEGDFLALLRAFCVECHLRGYINEPLFYMSEGEYDVPRRVKIRTVDDG